MSAWNEILWVVMLCGDQNAFNAESAFFSLNKTKTETMKKNCPLKKNCQLPGKKNKLNKNTVLLGIFNFTWHIIKLELTMVK